MTGNYFVATTHRVDHRRARFSSGYFHGPDLRTRARSAAAWRPSSPRQWPPASATPRAGFMARRDELVAGRDGIAVRGAGVYGQQLWNYYLRSYPDNVRRHYPDVNV